MAKLTLAEIASLRNDTSGLERINDNFDAIEDAIENTLSLDGTAPNSMEASLDMNDNRILNLPEALFDTDPVRKGEFDETIEDLILGSFGTVLADIATTGDAGDLILGTVPLARLGTGTPDATKFLSGDNSWQTISLTAAGITVGTSPIAGGTSTRVLYNNAGVLGEYLISGTGNVAMTTSPSFLTPALGTPSAAVLTNATGLPLSTGVTGTLPVANGGTGITSLGTGVATALGVNVGSAGAFVTFNGALGTPSSGTLTNVTGLPTLLVANEATDTTCFLGFFTAATGELGPKTNTNMTFNSNTGVATFASTVLTTTDINGGTVDGAVIGGSSAAAATVTTLTATDLVDISGASAGQIKFPGTQNASADAHTLDWYEEGTWTPLFAFASNGDLNITAHVIQSGSYTRIGRDVTTAGQDIVNITHTTATGGAKLTGLPFAAATISHSFVASSAFQGVTKATYTQFGFFILSGSTSADFYAFGSAVSISAVGVADMPTGNNRNLSFTCTYHV